MMKVSVKPCQDYDKDSVMKAVTSAIDQIGGIRKFVKKGETILLKPNLLVATAPEKAVTTHPEIVRAVARLVKKVGGVPVIGDCPSPATKLSTALRNSGIYKICLDEKIRIIDMQKPKAHKVDGKLFKAFTLSKAIDEVDGIINLCKFKTHMLTILTGAVKNLYGLIPGTIKLRYHATLKTSDLFSDMLLDLYLATKQKVRLNIMDGVLGMQGQGPFAGELVWPKMILASDDALALDATFTTIASAKGKVPLITLAKERGLLSEDSHVDIKYPIRLPNTTKNLSLIHI